MQQPRRLRNDRFGHLRAELRTYRTVTTSALVIPWCVGCEQHHAARHGGLCPVCESDRERAAA